MRKIGYEETNRIIIENDRPRLFPDETTNRLEAVSQGHDTTGISKV